MVDKITMIVTSCGRGDLLKKTLDSFDKYNAYPIDRRIIIDDSGDPAFQNTLMQDYGVNYEVIANNPKIGHLASIDLAYSRVKTPLIFHCEDDWEFRRPGFIEESIQILKGDPKMLQVWIREKYDSAHPEIPEIYRTSTGLPYQRMSQWDEWCGFSWNPGLRRLSDWQDVGGYASFKNESVISKHYQAQGYFAGRTLDGYCIHIGWNRHIHDPHQD